MALQPSSDGYQCQTDDGTEDTWSVTTEPAAAGRHVLRAFTYLHVQDEDSGVTRLVTGPCSYKLKRNERVILEPQSMVAVPSTHYCIVESPVVRADGLAVFDDGQARLRHGEREVRLHQPPFPLYPGETLACSVQPLPVVAGVPGLRLRAVQDTTDNEGIQRKVGDEWLVKKKGVYVPTIREEVVEVLELITLTRSQYCVVCIPMVNDKPQCKIVQGPQSFFLQPGEVLEGGLRDIFFLKANEGLDLIAQEAFADKTVQRCLGERWTVLGPAVVIPPVETEVLGRRSAILLGPNEGVYVQNTITGQVRAEIGKSYLLTAEERLWSKDLSLDAEKLLATYRNQSGAGSSTRDKTRTVTFWVPNDCYAAVENLSSGKCRDVRGPKLVTLQHDEQFCVFSLPGGTSVILNYSKSLTLPLERNKKFLTDHISMKTEKAQERRIVQMAWCVSPESLFGIDQVNAAFWKLRCCLLEDARKNSLRTEYATDDVKFTNIHISDTAMQWR